MPPPRQEKADKLLIDIEVESDKNGHVIPVFLLQEALSFEQALAYLDEYREPNHNGEYVIVGFVSEIENEDVGFPIAVFNILFKSIKNLNSYKPNKIWKRYNC